MNEAMKGVASVAVCAAASYCMYLSGGNAGMGWAIIGLFVIWAMN